MEETEELQTGERYFLLLMYLYVAHSRYENLNYLKNNNILVIGMPAHTSHILQLLEASVCWSFKSEVNREFHVLNRTMKLVDTFDLANALEISFQASHTI